MSEVVDFSGMVFELTGISPFLQVYILCLILTIFRTLGLYGDRLEDRRERLIDSLSRTLFNHG